MPTQYIIYPNPPITATIGPVTISGPVEIEDTAGNPITTTAGSVNVNITGGTSTANVNINGLVNFQTSQYTVGTSAVQVTPTPLANRSSISIKVTTVLNTDAIYIGNSSGVTTSTGYALFAGDSFQFDLTPAHQIWVIGTSAGQKVYAFEIGS